MSDSCANCRFGVSIGPLGGIEHARCNWIDGTHDEAGDRMPAWAHELLRESQFAVGRADRAESCPAFEVRP